MPDPRSWNPRHGCTKYSEGCTHCCIYVLGTAHKVPEKSSVVARTATMRMPLARNCGGESIGGTRPGDMSSHGPSNAMRAYLPAGDFRQGGLPLQVPGHHLVGHQVEQALEVHLLDFAESLRAGALRLPLELAEMRERRFEFGYPRAQGHAPVPDGVGQRVQVAGVEQRGRLSQREAGIGQRLNRYEAVDLGGGVVAVPVRRDLGRLEQSHAVVVQERVDRRAAETREITHLHQVRHSPEKLLDSRVTQELSIDFTD